LGAPISVPAFNQVLVLEDNGFGRKGEFVGFDVKAMRHAARRPGGRPFEKQPRDVPASARKGANLRPGRWFGKLQDQRDYESLELYTLKHLLGVR